MNLHQYLVMCGLFGMFSCKILIRRQIFYPDRPMVYTETPLLGEASRHTPVITTLFSRPSFVSPFALSVVDLEAHESTKPWPFVHGKTLSKEENLWQPLSEVGSSPSIPFTEAFLMHLSTLPIVPEAFPVGQTPIPKQTTPSSSVHHQSKTLRYQPFKSVSSVEGWNPYSSHHPFEASPKGISSYALPDATIHNIAGRAGKDYPVFTNIPVTSFKCVDHPLPGYYGDIETGCQVVHICQTDGRHSSFLCPNGTIFNQQFFVCDWWFNFDCSLTAALYKQNEKLYKPLARLSFY